MLAEWVFLLIHVHEQSAATSPALLQSALELLNLTKLSNSILRRIIKHNDIFGKLWREQGSVAFTAPGKRGQADQQRLLHPPP